MSCVVYCQKTLTFRIPLDWGEGLGVLKGEDAGNSGVCREFYFVDLFIIVRGGVDFNNGYFRFVCVGCIYFTILWDYQVFCIVRIFLRNDFGRHTWFGFV